MSRQLLAIIEMGGYPNLAPLYQRLGYEVSVVHSQRNARKEIKKRPPDVVVAEYNLQSDFRDRSSNLETLAAVLQKYPDTRLLVFYLPEFEERFHQFQQLHRVSAALPLPVTEARVERVLGDI